MSVTCRWEQPGALGSRKHWEICRSFQDRLAWRAKGREARLRRQAAAKKGQESRYDAEATEDRHAIAHYMERGTRSRPETPAFPATSISSMDNKTFARELDKLGIDPALT
jgi:hypothetical protein